MLCVSVQQLCVCLELISGWLHTNRCIVNSVLPVWPCRAQKTKKPVTPPINRHTMHKHLPDTRTRLHIGAHRKFNGEMCNEWKTRHTAAFMRENQSVMNTWRKVFVDSEIHAISRHVQIYYILNGDKRCSFQVFPGNIWFDFEIFVY